MRSQPARPGRLQPDQATLCPEPTGPGERHQKGQFDGKSDPKQNASGIFTVGLTPTAAPIPGQASKGFWMNLRLLTDNSV